MTTVEQAVRRTMHDLVTLDTVNVEQTTDHVMSYELPEGTKREEVKEAVERELERLKALQARGQA